MHVTGHIMQISWLWRAGTVLPGVVGRTGTHRGWVLEWTAGSTGPTWSSHAGCGSKKQESPCSSSALDVLGDLQCPLSHPYSVVRFSKGITGVLDGGQERPLPDQVRCTHARDCGDPKRKASHTVTSLQKPHRPGLSTRRCCLAYEAQLPFPIWETLPLTSQPFISSGSSRPRPSVRALNADSSQQPGS